MSRAYSSWAIGDRSGEERTVIAGTAAGGLTIGQRRVVVEIPKKRQALSPL